MEGTEQGLESTPSTHRKGSDVVGKETLVGQAAECPVETIEEKLWFALITLYNFVES